MALVTKTRVVQRIRTRSRWIHSSPPPLGLGRMVLHEIIFLEVLDKKILFVSDALEKNYDIKSSLGA